jgi:hypothetical protein
MSLEKIRPHHLDESRVRLAYWKPKNLAPLKKASAPLL